MNEIAANEDQNKGLKKDSTLKLFLIITGAVFCSLVLALLVARFYLFPREFVPEDLSIREERILDAKISRLSEFHGNMAVDPGGETAPEPYREAEGNREISFSEKELNGLIAREPELAKRFSLDLSENLASGKLLIPLDQDFPLLGGKTLKVTAGLELAFVNGRPIVKLKGVSVWGVPLPNAWLGDLKNVDLVEEYGDQGGFWASFAAGIEEIRVEEGRLLLRLKE